MSISLIINAVVIICVLGLVYVTWQVVKVRNHMKRGEYDKAWHYFKRIGLVDRNNQGAISMEFAALLALKAGDIDNSVKYLNKAMSLGAFPIHYLIRLLIGAKKGDWADVENSRQTLYGVTVQQNLQDTIKWSVLDTMIEQRDVGGLLSLLRFEKFSVAIDERLDSHKA